MIENLSDYGIFGLWTISNLTIIWFLLKLVVLMNKERRVDNKESLVVISKNTQSNTLLAERINNLKVAQ